MSLFRGMILILLFVFIPLTGSAQSQGEKAKAPEATKTDKAKESDNLKKSDEKAKSSQAKPETDTTKDTMPDSKTPTTVPEKSEQKPVPKETKPMGDSSKTDSSRSAPADGVETLEVTGSYIRRSDIEGPSPIVIIDREKIEKSGFNSVGAVLNRHTTISPFGSGGGLKGLGSSRTLILINGQRAPGAGTSYRGGGTVNVNTIPVAAVERIEILKDGASATYGSDALGGVINIITRKDLDGMAVTGKYDMTDYKGGDTLRTSVAYGDSNSKGNFLTSLQYIHGTRLRYSDIKRVEFLADDYTSSLNYKNSSTEGKTTPAPGCERFDRKGRCEDHVTSQYFSGPSHSLDWVTNGEYKVFGDLKLYSTLYLGYGSSRSQNIPATFETITPAGSFPGMRIAQAPPQMASSIGSGPATIYGRIKEMPGRSNEEENLAVGLIVGLKGYLGSTNWIWDVSVNNQFDYNRGSRKNFALFAPVEEAVTNGTYNPFGSARNTQGFAYNSTGNHRSQVNWLEAKANGDLGSLFGFSWASAVGASVAHFEYSEKEDPRVVNLEVMGIRGTISSAQRQLYAVFGELSGLYRNIEVQLALRGDMYSDFGSTVNPKLAVMYQPLSWMTLRTSFGTGFQAPLLQDVYGPRLQGYVDVTDQRGCNEGKIDPCENNYYLATQGSNPNLKEETSWSFNVGTVIELMKNLNFSVDYWNVVVNDTIGSDPQGVLQLEALDPSTPQRYGAAVNRDKENAIESLEVYLQNLGKEEAHGIDFQGSFKMVDPIFKGTLSLSSELSYMFYYYESFYQELGREQVLGQYHKPRWKNVSNLSYELGSFRGQLTSRIFPKMEKKARKQGHIPGHPQFDITLGYTAPWGGRFQLGAINAFNDPPNYDYTSGSRVNTTLYSAERTWFTAYRQDF